MSAHGTSSFRSFGSNEDGTVAIIFGLSFFIMLFCIGFAIDSARAYHAAGKVASALDAAALAAAKAMKEQNLSDGQTRQRAKEYFEGNIKGSASTYAKLKALKVDIDRDAGAVKVSVEGEVKTLFAQLAHYDRIPFQKSSVAIYNPKDLEIGMALDITGSMGGRKLADLKRAASKAVDILLSDSTPGRKIRIGLAPYAASVNAGLPLARRISDNASVDGCVVERSGVQAYGDDQPRVGHWFNAVPSLAVTRNGNYSCPSATIMPLSNDAVALKRSITSYSAGGFTAGHIGAAWAWYLISPEWNVILPGDDRAGYNDGKTIKAVILMTDGEFNTSYLNGTPNRTSSRQALEICDRMKDRDHSVVVYTIGFELTDPTAIDTLRRCASSPGHFFPAGNGPELEAAFVTIASNLARLRLAK